MFLLPQSNRQMILLKCIRVFVGVIQLFLIYGLTRDILKKKTRGGKKYGQRSAGWLQILSSNLKAKQLPHCQWTSAFFNIIIFIIFQECFFCWYIWRPAIVKGLLKQRIFLQKKKQDKGFDLFNTQVQLLTRAFMYIDILIIDLKLPSITQLKKSARLYFFWKVYRFEDNTGNASNYHIYKWLGSRLDWQ